MSGCLTNYKYKFNLKIKLKGQKTIIERKIWKDKKTTLTTR